VGSNFVELDKYPQHLVKEGDELCLGKHTLKFVMAPMVHWPEVMLAFEETEGVLFSADAFGKFGALEFEEDNWADEARRYYINIVGKYGAPVQTVLKKAAALDIKKIAPLHGPVLSENLEKYIGLYDTWSSYKPEESGVLVAYASIHGNTELVAKYVAKKLEEKGEKVVLTDLTRQDKSQAVADAFRFDRMVLAASSYDGGVFIPMEDFLVDLSYKTYQNRKVALIENGSWGPTAGRKMKGHIEGFKNVEIIGDMVTIKSRAKDVDYANVDALVEAVVAAKN
jgi:flavorubredoxin